MRVLAVILATVCVSACNGGSKNPVAPTPQFPSISGQWSGRYTVTSCTENAIAAGACAAIGGGGTHSLTPTQSGANFSGQLGVGVFSLPITGSVDAAGVVTLAGSAPVTSFTLTITSWRGVVTGGTLTGTMGYSAVANGGIVTVAATFALTR